MTFSVFCEVYFSIVYFSINYINCINCQKKSPAKKKSSKVYTLDIFYFL